MFLQKVFYMIKLEGAKVSHSHNLGLDCPSIFFHLNERHKEAFFLMLGGPGLKALLLSAWGTVGTNQGRQLFDKIPQGWTAFIPPFFVTSSTETLL